MQTIYTAKNMRTGEERIYIRSENMQATDAVIAAYAQSKGDWNTWDYRKRYAHMVRSTNMHVFLLDWGVKVD